MWLSYIETDDLRNLRRAIVEPGQGLNVLVGHNAQGKTSFLEAIGLLSRGRSFRADRIESVVTEGRSRAVVRGRVTNQDIAQTLQVELGSGVRRFLVDSAEVRPVEYFRRLPVVVYATEGLKVVRGPMRERRQFVDRAAALIWPSYRHLVQRYGRIVIQRNASLQNRGSGLEAWDERLVTEGSTLRQRRMEFVERLKAELSRGSDRQPERWSIDCGSAITTDVEGQRQRFLGELRSAEANEKRCRTTLVGPHRDKISLLIDGREAAVVASSGQARSLLLALTFAVAAVYQQEVGIRPITLLDDLDSELDAERAVAICHRLAAAGQAFVTTAHPEWTRPIQELGRMFQVAGGEISPRVAP